MSRYEKINYDELEMLAANGGREIDVDCHSHTPISPIVSSLVTWYTKRYCTKDFACRLASARKDCKIVPIAPPEEIQP